MSPVRIKPRTLTSKCPVCGGTTHFTVVGRFGGRGFPELTFGTFHYKREAKTRRDFVAGELAAGRDPRVTLRDTLAAGPPPKLELGKTIPTYIASRHDYSSESARAAHVRLQRAVDHFGATYDLATLTAIEAIDYVAALADELKPSTVAAYIRAFRQLLDYADIHPNPARDPRVKLPTLRYQEVAPPSSEHTIAILDRVAPKMVLRLVAIEQTAMAIGETSTLAWGDVDVPGQRFRLRRATVKGQIAARARWVQVPDWLMRILDEQVPAEDRVGDRLVFLPYATPAAVTRAMHRACTAAKIPLYSAHDLRHRRISLWHGQGIPARELAARAGHSRASMTLDTYSHVMALDEIPRERLLQLAGRAR